MKKKIRTTFKIGKKRLFRNIPCSVKGNIYVLEKRKKRLPSPSPPPPLTTYSLTVYFSRYIKKNIRMYYTRTNTNTSMIQSNKHMCVICLFLVPQQSSSSTTFDFICSTTMIMMMMMTMLIIIYPSFLWQFSFCLFVFFEREREKKRTENFKFIKWWYLFEQTKQKKKIAIDIFNLMMDDSWDFVVVVVVVDCVCMCVYECLDWFTSFLCLNYNDDDDDVPMEQSIIIIIIICDRMIEDQRNNNNNKGDLVNFSFPLNANFFHFSLSLSVKNIHDNMFFYL